MPFTKREKQEDETIIFTFLNIYVYCIHNMHTAQHASNMYFRGNGETFCHQLKRVEREYEKIVKNVNWLKQVKWEREHFYAHVEKKCVLYFVGKPGAAGLPVALPATAHSIQRTWQPHTGKSLPWQLWQSQLTNLTAMTEGVYVSDSHDTVNWLTWRLSWQRKLTNSTALTEGITSVTAMTQSTDSHDTYGRESLRTWQPWQREFT